MYAFQEVHEHYVENYFKQSRSHWRAFHEESGLWIKYRTKGLPPVEPYPWVFDEWAGMTDGERLISKNTGKQLPVLKLGETMKTSSLKLSDLQKAKEALMKANVPGMHYMYVCDDWHPGLNPFSLGNCEATAPCIDFPSWEVYGTQQEQGNNPMAYSTATAINVSGGKSDEMIQREYLLDQLRSTYETWRDPSIDKLRKLFNMDGPGRPTKTLDVIDAIKNGKYTLDDKKLKKLADLQEEYDEDAEDYDAYSVYSPLYGMIFTDFPLPDEKGYNAARVEWIEVLKNARNKIMILPPAEGLDILTALADWTPTVGNA